MLACSLWRSRENDAQMLRTTLPLRWSLLWQRTPPIHPQTPPHCYLARPSRYLKRNKKTRHWKNGAISPAQDNQSRITCKWTAAQVSRENNAVTSIPFLFDVRSVCVCYRKISNITSPPPPPHQTNLGRSSSSSWVFRRYRQKNDYRLFFLREIT